LTQELTHFSSMRISLSRTQFDPLAERYSQSEVHRAGASLPVLIRLAEPEASDVVLDVATGPGNTAFALADSVRSVIAIDIAPRMLEQGRRRAETEGKTNVSFQEASAEALPFESTSFSLVVSRHAPHHFHDAAKFLSEVYRVLTDQGRFIIADQISPAAEISGWLNDWERTRDPSHFFQRTVSEWQELARVAGFSWIKHEIVPYRLQFDWWTAQANCDAARIAWLRQHVQRANPEVIKWLDPEFDHNKELFSFIEPMLVARMERHSSLQLE
jgi:ubiquinone/menaquinone biosynthesis C-methylase UbiE